ncbi:MAG: amino acid ABC transporter permease [Synergistaceae bacterium]
MLGRFYEQFIIGEGLALMQKGVIVTLGVSLVALIIGTIIGIIAALMKIATSRKPIGKIICKIANIIANIYINLFRGTPVVVQLLLAYFGIMGPLGADPLYVAFVVLGLNSGAYVAEIIRSGILSVDKGQMEAGRSLGLPYGTTMFHIIIPQAIKNILPALGNELIALIKETSVVGFISVFDMTRATRSVISTTYDAFVPYIVLALAYLIIVMIATTLVDAFERRLRRSDNR